MFVFLRINHRIGIIMYYNSIIELKEPRFPVCCFTGQNPGYCPPQPPGMAGCVSGILCEGDLSCQGTQKCCNTICGRICLEARPQRIYF